MYRAIPRIGITGFHPLLVLYRFGTLTKATNSRVRLTPEITSNSTTGSAPSRHERRLHSPLH